MTYDKKAPFKGKLQRVTSISFRCSCPAGKDKKNPCGVLTVYDLLDGEMEVGGIFLKPKSVAKLIKFLQK
jgi:hypothetical protein